MATTNEAFVFSSESVEFRDQFQSLLSERLRLVAVELARSERRHEITLADVQTSLPEAIACVMSELRLAADAQRDREKMDALAARVPSAEELNIIAATPAEIWHGDPSWSDNPRSPGAK